MGYVWSYLASYGLFGILFIVFTLWFSITRIVRLNTLDDTGVVATSKLFGAIAGAAFKAFVAAFVIAVLLYVGLVVAYGLV